MSHEQLPESWIDYLSRLDVERLDLTNDEILDAVEGGLRLQGSGEAVIEPRVHLEPGVSNGHFNVLRGSLGGDIDLAGVKVVGDFVDNYKVGLPSELALLNLMDRRTGLPRAVVDASYLTDMRTGAVTALGAKHLARKGSKVLGHIGARGTAYWNVRLLDHLFDFDEIRVHSLRSESREAFARKLSEDLGKPVVATTDWETCVRGADVIVEASRLERPEVQLRTEWISRGAFVVPYGTMSAVDIDLLTIIDKVVVDDWGQCKGGKFGSLRAHVEQGLLSESTLHGELCQVVVGDRAGRKSDDETTLLWHRGLSLSDIALGHAMLRKAATLGIGQKLRYS
jgi:ornithine cyclodeaminase